MAEHRLTACRFCAGERVAPAFVVGDRNRGVSDRLFTYVRCATCDSLSLPDPPGDLGDYYDADYYGLVPRERLDRAAAEDRWRIDEFVVGRVARGGPAIEIGPGNGRFAHLLAREGFEVHVVERDAAACEYLRDVVGVHVVATDDPVAGIAALPQAHLIALWHVLEHVPEPAALLSAIARRLAPGGIAVIALPNLHALGHRLLGRRWPHIDAPRHLTLPPPEALLARLRSEGLDVESVRTDDPGARHYNWFAWDRALRPLRLPSPIHRRAASAVTRALHRAETRGSSLTVVARRPAVRSGS